ncbi:MAG: hypothetical protein M3Q07_08945 [Pseudobdellovibrionaceae bacterium]|nr:hypothetical protein [Pseudobdellovibrionaceae bacterium]
MSDARLDLFTKLEIETVHPHFATLLNPDRAHIREEILQWSAGFQDRDRKFIREFQTTFWSSFWELYLFQSFKRLGFNTDFSVSSPDFLLSNEAGSIFNAEAAVALSAQGMQTTYTPIDQESDLDVDRFLEYAAVRISNGINEKIKKYLKHYSKLTHVQDRPFVLCIAPYEQPLTHLQNDRAIRWVLYGYDVPIISSSESGFEILGHATKSKIRKNDNTTLKTALFLDPGNNFLSGIFFSTVATIQRARIMSPIKTPNTFVLHQRYAKNGLVPKFALDPLETYQEGFLDGLIYFENPNAFRKIDIRPLIESGVGVYRYDVSSNMPVEHFPENFLIQRQIEVLQVQDDGDKLVLKEQVRHQFNGTGKKSFETLEPVDVQIGHWLHNHMVHYKGWTIVVMMCPVDRDWGWIAVEEHCLDMQEFVARNQDENVRSLIASEFLESKDEAFNRAKQKIDAYIEAK